MSRIEKNVFITNAPHKVLGFGLPKRRYRDDFDDEEPLDLPSTFQNRKRDEDDDDDAVEAPFRNQYGWDDDDEEYLPSTASKKTRMREILTNDCCGDGDGDPLYIPSTLTD
jgi:hypothetical protein